MLATTLFLLGCCELGLAAPLPTPPDLHVAPLDPRDEIRFITNYRSTPEIIWTCVITTLLCTWVSVHPHIVGYNSTRWQRFYARLTLFLESFAAPERPLLHALRQWMFAMHIASKMNERVLKSPQEPIENAKSTLWERLASKMGIKQEKNARRWTTVHGHFLLMGGVIFSVNGRLQYLQLQRLIESDDKESNDDGPNDKGPNDKELYASARTALESLPTRDMEISDRSKGDAITKGLTLLQTGWFIVQLASRRVQNLNVTALEILTLAYAVMNLFVYIFWWNKPFNVQSPIVINLTVKQEGTRPQSSHSDEAKVQPVLEASSPPLPDAIPAYGTDVFIKYVPMGPTISTPSMDVIASVVLVVLLGLSGAIHYIAWDFAFPLPIGRTLWRIFCSLITVAPFAAIVVGFILILIAILLLLILGCICCSLKLPKDVLRNKAFGKTIAKIVFVTFYSVCRLMLVSLALWSLSDLPPDAHETVVWSRYVPHF